MLFRNSWWNHSSAAGLLKFKCTMKNMYIYLDVQIVHSVCKCKLSLKKKHCFLRIDKLPIATKKRCPKWGPQANIDKAITFGAPPTVALVANFVFPLTVISSKRPSNYIIGCSGDRFHTCCLLYLWIIWILNIKYK